MNRDTCVHYTEPGRCRALKPACANYADGTCRTAGKLEPMAPAPNYAVRVSRWSPGGGVQRHCRVCGCTDTDCRQCIAKTGKPCHWVEPDLCSACAQGQK